MASGYSYKNSKGKIVRGRAADNHWLSEHGYKRIADLIDDVACRTAIKTAREIKSELGICDDNSSNIIMYKSA